MDGDQSMNEEKCNSPGVVEKTMPITEYAAKFGEVTTGVFFGDVGERPDLSKHCAKDVHRPR